MDTIPGNDPMENPPQPPLAGLDPADLLKQGAAEDTFVDGAPFSFNPPTIEELAKLFPQFEILELIGKGGMGAVYKVRQKELDRIVALKILPPAIGETPGFAARFAREAKALAKLNHPGIVTIHEFGSSSQLSTPNSQPLFYFLMEYVDGVNLAQLMRTGRISPREALAIVPQICDALQFAHDQGIVHRDIKPENILLDRLGRVKVADFGIAKFVAAVCDRRTDDEVRPSQTDATLAGKIMGTPQYMAPEQIDHPSDVDHRADIYALGVVFYQMLTGELPGKDLQAPSKKVHIDVRLDEMVLRALEKEPELRYQTAKDMKTRVEAVTQNIVAPEYTPSRARSNKIKWMVAACFVTGVLWLALRQSGRVYPASSLNSAYKAPVMGRIKFKFTHPESPGGKGVSYDVKKWGDTQWTPNSGTGITLTGGQSLWFKTRVDATRSDAPVAMVTTSSDHSRWETKELKIDGKDPLSQLFFSNGLRVEIQWSPAVSPVGPPESPDPIQQQVMQRASRLADEMHPVSHPENDAKTLAEPPKLQFIGWQSPRKEVWHPDGSPVTDPEELAWLREIGPNYAYDRSKGEAIRGMTFWFSHPLLEKSNTTELQFLDEQGRVIPEIDGMDGKRSETRGKGGQLGWSVMTLAVDTTRPLIIRLNYTLGPLEKIKEQIVEPNNRGSSFGYGNTSITAMGQNAGGQSFLMLAVEEAEQSVRRFGVIAVTKNGREIVGDWFRTGGSGSPMVETFDFNVPIADVAKFRIGTRPLRTVDWKDLPVGPPGPQKAVIGIFSDGEISLDGKAVSLAALNEELNRVHRGHPDLSVVIRSSPLVTYTKVVEVMEACRKAGIAKMDFADGEKNSPDKMKIDFDRAGDTMQKIVIRFRSDYGVRLCFENLDIGLKRDGKPADSPLDSEETERLRDAYNFSYDRKLGGFPILDLGARYEGRIVADSVEDFLNQVTRDTPFCWHPTERGKTWVIMPREGSQLEFPVTLQIENLAVDEAVMRVTGQRPSGSITYIQSAGWSVAKGTTDAVPWLSVKCKPQKFDQVPAWQVLCDITEGARPDSVWALYGYKEQRTLVVPPGPSMDYAVVSQAQIWMCAVDSGSLLKSWEQAAEFFKKSVTPDQWRQSMESFRKPLGEPKFRKLKNVTEATSLAGAPDGRYLVMQFETVFASERRLSELVTFQQGKDGIWRAAAYSIQ
ncbi:MAG: DUF4019 domain-containing protein [Luteolibacter sp.]|uniref:protein kinase domain-containing protein n=1 Tax=Luteolibacter sp. TaxID=1962973 RepID=UPI003265A06D